MKNYATPFPDFFSLQNPLPLPTPVNMKDINQLQLVQHLSDDLQRSAARRELLRREVTIDETFLIELPINNNLDIYLDLGMTLRSITLSGVNEPSLGCLLQVFRTVENIVLDRIEILRPCLTIKVVDPETHMSLKLSNCTINRDFLRFWFTKMRTSLRTVHLDRLKCDFLRPGQLGDFLNPLANLTNLSVEGMILDQFDLGFRGTKLEMLTIINVQASIIRMSQPMSKLQYLKIDATSPIKCNSSAKKCFPALKHLWLRCPDRAWPKFLQNQLKTLQLHNPPVKIEKITRLRALDLEKVKITCNWYDADKLRRHFDRFPAMKSCVISTNALPAPDPSTISKLNSDCWQCILSFLPAQRDIFNLAIVIPKLFALQNSKTTLCIDPTFLKANPGGWSMGYKKSLALNTSQLSFQFLQWPKIVECLPAFANLVRLELDGLRKVKPTAADILRIPMVKELKLSKTLFSGVTLRLVLLHLQPSLRTLHVVEYDQIFEYLMGLKDIQRLTVEKINLSNDMFVGAFLKQNRRLEHVTFKTNFSIITLKPLLAWLPPSLKTLDITGSNFELFNGSIPEFIGPYPDLEELSLKTAEVLTETDVIMLAHLKKLTTLRIYDGVLTEDVIMVLLNRISTLVHLYFDRLPSLSLTFEVDLRRWLREHGRIVYFHGGEWEKRRRDLRELY